MKIISVMTNKEELTNHCDSHLVRLLAVHLVRQVLDDAYFIANAALESGQPWRYQKMMRNFGETNELCVNEEEEVSLISSQGDNNINENNVDLLATIVATSTPQKLQVTGETNNRGQSNYVGQGDEDLDLSENELSKSTSMFINYLFDMSDVERVMCNSSVISEDAMCQRVDYNVNFASGVIHREEMLASTEAKSDKLCKSSESSAFSFLDDVSAMKINETSAFFINDDGILEENVNEPCITVSAEVQEITNRIEREKKDNVVERYENTYLTLNREYDQGSEEDEESVLQDPKGLSLHEIELMTANTSEEKLCASEKDKEEGFVAVSMASASASGSHKSSLARRCKIQGVKLLSCFKGWWRRKPPAKKKELHFLGPNEGMCPISPNARRRGSSLLDNRIHQTPSPSRPIIWKFNTVTEAVINSSRWKDYTFEDKPEE